MVFNDLLFAGVVLPILALASVAASRPVGRWIARQLKETMNEAVTEIVKPHLSILGTSIAELAALNSREHAENQARLTAIEKRLGEFTPTPELMKRHLEIVARLDALTAIARAEHPEHFDREEP